MFAGHRVRSFFACTFLLGSFFLVAATRGDDQKTNSAAKPVPRGEKWWNDRHQSFVKVAEKGDVDVLFLGDSITQGWEREGKKVWKEDFAALKAANFGIGGDQTQHVLWRLRDGKELHGI